MLILLSPAKKLDFDSALGALPDVPFSVPDFAEHSAMLAELARRLSPPRIERLMSISNQLAGLNFERWQDWEQPEQPSNNCRQAIFAFQGDVYLGLQAQQLSPDDLAWAQDRLRILSGLHGLLRPLDLIRPYRLEMGTNLKNPEGKNLYDLWRPRLTDTLSDLLLEQDNPWVLNLASVEYSKAVDLKQLGVPVVSPSFHTLTRSGWRSTMYNTKRARGLMASWVISERLEHPEQLEAFSGEGYSWQEAISSPLNPVFHGQKTAAAKEGKAARA